MTNHHRHNHTGLNSVVEGTDLVATEEAEVGSDKVAEEQEGDEKAQEPETAAAWIAFP